MLLARNYRPSEVATMKSPTNSVQVGDCPANWVMFDHGILFFPGTVTLPAGEIGLVGTDLATLSMCSQQKCPELFQDFTETLGDITH